MRSKLSTLVATAALSLVITTPSFAAIEINEDDFGPSYGTMVADTALGKPLQLASAVVGTATFIVSLPFTIAGQNVEQAQQKLVVEPWQAMGRCLGCTVAEDNYYKAQTLDAYSDKKNEYRIIVDQPSEIVINTNDNVVVVPR